jgi:hypothetical protein
VYQVEQAADPADEYDTVDAFLDAVCAALAEERSQQSEHQRVAHDHSKRLS